MPATNSNLQVRWLSEREVLQSRELAKKLTFMSCHVFCFFVFWSCHLSFELKVYCGVSFLFSCTLFGSFLSSKNRFQMTSCCYHFVVGEACVAQCWSELLEHIYHIRITKCDVKYLHTRTFSFHLLKLAASCGQKIRCKQLWSMCCNVPLDLTTVLSAEMLKFVSLFIDFGRPDSSAHCQNRWKSDCSGWGWVTLSLVFGILLYFIVLGV